MTTTPTASPELPDLDLFKMERAATKWAEVHFRHAINFTRADVDIVLAAWKEATSQAIAARRAKPEGEAPQAVHFYRRAPNENWRETTAEHIAHLKLFNGYEYRTLYTAPAATLSPLRGGQHAESGKEAAPAEDRKGIELWRATLRACGELPEGYEVCIELENCCGMAVWYDAEGERHVIDGEGYLSDDVNEAVDLAIQHAAAPKGGA